MCLGERAVKVEGPNGETWEWVVKAYIQNHVTVALNEILTVAPNEISTPCSFEANWNPEKKQLNPKSKGEPQWEAAQKLLGDKFDEARRVFSLAVRSILEHQA